MEPTHMVMARHMQCTHNTTNESQLANWLAAQRVPRTWVGAPHTTHPCSGSVAVARRASTRAGDTATSLRFEWATTAHNLRICATHSTSRDRVAPDKAFSNACCSSSNSAGRTIQACWRSAAMMTFPPGRDGPRTAPGLSRSSRKKCETAGSVSTRTEVR
jgi:hypothetical protein